MERVAATLVREDGVRVDGEWLEQLEGLVGPGALLGAARRELRSCDLREVGAGGLLPDLYGAGGAAQMLLDGPFYLQLQHWQDVGRPKQQGDGLVEVEGEGGGEGGTEVAAEGEGEGYDVLPGLRRAPSGPSTAAAPSLGRRMLKLHCSDGVQDVFAFEYRPVPALVLQPGSKLIVRNVRVMRGLLALTPQVVAVVGGGWPQQQPEQAQASLPEEAAMAPVDDFEIDLAELEAIEKAALAARVHQQNQQTVVQRAPAPAFAPASAPVVSFAPKKTSASSPSSSSSQSSAAGTKRRTKRRYLDDSDE